MKRFLIAFDILLILILLSSCETSIETKSHSQLKSDSLSAARADSMRSIDPWIKYTYSERQGKRYFESYCVVCHGKTGEGDGFNSYNLNPRPHSFTDSTYMAALSDETLAEIIAFGGRGVNKSVLMPAYQNTLTKEQIANVVAYIRTFFEKP